MFIKTNLIDNLFVDELSPTPAELQKREQILASLERFIRKEYNGKSSTFSSTGGLINRVYTMAVANQ